MKDNSNNSEQLKLLSSKSFFTDILGIGTSNRQKNPLHELSRGVQRDRLLLQIQSLNRSNPYVGVGLFVVGGISIGLGFWSSQQKREAINEINFRKSQMSKPVYELSGEEVVDVPWNESNLQEWLYRPVRITGRPMHYKTIMIPERVHNYNGYAYIVPLVTRENNDKSEQWGVLLNKGWIPNEYKDTSNRMKIEDVFPQTFEGIVTLNKELQDIGGLTGGNSFKEGRNNWSHLYLPDAAKFSGLKNENKVRIALIEQVQLNSPLDERNMNDRNINSSYTEDYPYAKTRAGALQLPKMPWDYDKQTQAYFAVGILSSTIGFLAKFAR